MTQKLDSPKLYQIGLVTQQMTVFTHKVPTDAARPLGITLDLLLVNNTALHCTALHCTALHCTALHCTALHYTALHCTALHQKGRIGRVDLKRDHWAPAWICFLIQCCKGLDPVLQDSDHTMSQDHTMFKHHTKSHHHTMSQHKY